MRVATPCLAGTTTKTGNVTVLAQMRQVIILPTRRATGPFQMLAAWAQQMVPTPHLVARMPPCITLQLALRLTSFQPQSTGDPCSGE